MSAMTHFVYFSGLTPNTSEPQHPEIGDVCIANISPYERRKRLMFAIWQFVVTLVLLGVLILLELNPLWRLPLFFLLSASTVSYFQSRDKT
jgi:hypothetical protein